MESLAIVEQTPDGSLFTTSATIADHAGVQHKNTLELIDRSRNDLEEFGEVAFETRAGYNNAKVRVAQLNEQQASLLLTYLRNTAQVRTFKKNLVREFYRMAQALRGPAAPMGELEIMARANEIQQRVIAEKDQTITQQAAQIEEAQPKLRSFNSFVSSTADYNSRSAAQILSRDHGITVGQNRLLAWLRKCGWIGEDNLPYQRHVDLGRLNQYGGFKGFTRVNGTHQNYKPSLRITTKGIHDIAVAMRKEAKQPELELTT